MKDILIPGLSYDKRNLIDALGQDNIPFLYKDVVKDAQYRRIASKPNRSLLLKELGESLESLEVPPPELEEKIEIL